jgi:hypothetical protein
MFRLPTESPPANVDVAFVDVARIVAKVGVEVPTMRVPSNDNREEEGSVELFVPPFAIGRTPVTCEVSELWPDNVPRDKQLPAIAKHPPSTFHPPVPTSVDVAVVKLATLPIENFEPGVDVPTPILPLLSIVSAGTVEVANVVGDVVAI